MYDSNAEQYVCVYTWPPTHTDEMTPRHIQRPRVQSKLRSCSADFAPVSSIIQSAAKSSSGGAAAASVGK
jgi:hypothetical protein